MNNIVGKVAIVGAAESDKIGVVPDKSLIQLHAEAAHNALSEAGLTVETNYLQSSNPRVKPSVISQLPAAGTTVYATSVVSIEVTVPPPQ